MLLSKTRMQKIVEELRGSINRDINIMDRTGEIIASTDHSRVGMLHQGAKKIINQKMKELLIGDETCYKGAKPGINFPIFINDEIVGVVGITGERKEVEPFGKIIKKMTEIMISEEQQKAQNQLIESAKSNFVYSWLFDVLQDDEKEKKNFIMKGKLLEINITEQRVVVVLYINDLDESGRIDFERGVLNNNIMKRIKNLLTADDQNVVVQIGTKIIILLHSESSNDALDKMNLLKEQIEQRYQVKIAGGIGSLGNTVEEIRRSYKEAEIACDMMSNLKNMGIKVYGDMDMEGLLLTISQQNQLHFFQKIFCNCPGKDIANYLSLLRVLVENDGSITHTAEELFLHKNTVQYRLSKLKALTGYDPRNMKEMVPLYVAMMIYEENKESWMNDS